MWIQKVVDEMMTLIFTGWSPHMCEECFHLNSFSVWYVCPTKTTEFLLTCSDSNNTA